MRSIVLALLGFVGVVGASSVWAAADIDFREARLRHVCEGGPTPGAVCCTGPSADPTTCATGTCVLDTTGKVNGILTLIIDDDVSTQTNEVVPGRRLKAFTLLLETKGKQGALLAQTFQRLDASTLDTLLDGLEAGPPDEFGFPATESNLRAILLPALPPPGTKPDLGWLIFRTIDPETLRRLRTSAGLDPDGPELLVIQPTKLKLDRYQDASAADDPHASVLRAKLSTFFVAPKDPSCP